MPGVFGRRWDEWCLRPVARTRTSAVHRLLVVQWCRACAALASQGKALPLGKVHKKTLDVVEGYMALPAGLEPATPGLGTRKGRLLNS